MPTINYHVRTAQAQAALAQLEHRMTMTSSIIAGSTKMADTAIMAVAASFVAMGAGAFVAYNAVSQFQESLTTVRALGGVTEAQMYELADAVNEVAAQFGVSGDEIAAGAVMLSKAGLSVDEINESISAMTALSKANGITFEESARMTVFAVNTFGKEFSEATGLMDAMQVATQKSILDIADLQKAFAFAGSTAVMSGVSFEQLISIMAVLSNRALEAGISARSVNKMFLDMILNTDELQEWMTSMGMTFEIIKDGALDIDALMEAFSGQHLTLEMLQSASEIFTVRALRSFGLLIGAADEYGIMLADVTNSQGALQEVVAIQMESFTAMFGKLRQELLAPLRTPAVMEQVGEMVDGFIIMFQELKPDLLNTVILGLKGFSDILTSESFLNAVGFLGDGLLTIFQALNFIARLAQGPLGFFLKFAIAMKLAQIAMIPLLYLTESHARAMSLHTIEVMKNSQAIREKELAYANAVIGANNFYKQEEAMRLGAQLEVLMWKKKQLAIQAYAMNVQMATQAVVGLMMGGMMLGSADDPLMMGMGALMVMANALNTTLMIRGALATATYAGPAFIPTFIAMMGIQAAAAIAFRASRAKQTSDLDKMVVADTGMISNRHQLAYVEPGEQIISKTQGMVGMGAGLTVNIGDVYAQDGTDFARRLADELPQALRMSGYRGTF